MSICFLLIIFRKRSLQIYHCLHSCWNAFLSKLVLLLLDHALKQNADKVSKSKTQWPPPQKKKKKNVYHSNLATILITYESPILRQILDLISPAKINLFEPRFELYDLWDMANWLLWFLLRILKIRIFYCKKTKYVMFFFVSCTREPEYINEYGSASNQLWIFKK